MQALFTIGYEGRKIEDVVAALLQHDVDLLLDVRAVVSSRKPGFSKGPLSRSLVATGIEYWHERRFGTSSDVRQAYRKSGDAETFRDAYRTYLASVADVVAEYGLKLRGRRCCLLCLEADPGHCHRSLLADALAVHLGAQPQHL